MESSTELLRRRPRSLALELVEALGDRIRDGRLAAGDKLPTEAEFMAEFGVSRTVVREAISKLQASGLVQTRHGIGTFVVGLGDAAPFKLAPEQFATLRDVIVRLRVHFEPAPVALARFERLLALAGWREETPDAQLSRFLLRLPPRLVLVDETCPRVTPSMIDGALGTALACRVLEVRYRIDLDGCGVPPANTTLAAFFGTTA